MFDLLRDTTLLRPGDAALGTQMPTRVSSLQLETMSIYASKIMVLGGLVYLSRRHEFLDYEAAGPHLGHQQIDVAHLCNEGSGADNRCGSRATPFFAHVGQPPERLRN